jgi:DNA polymerase elongation subunit (family B)
MVMVDARPAEQPETGVQGPAGPSTAATPPVYGLDIETDTTTDGLDPDRSAVVAIALVGPDGSHLFDGTESESLTALDETLRELPTGIVATWNGAAFDLPFLARRAARAGTRLGLELVADPSIAMRSEPIAGETCAYRARWFDHAHLDGYRLYRADVGKLLGLSCGLKPMARLVGLDPVQVDRARLHELTADEVRAYVTSDARITRELVMRRMPVAAAFADRLVPGG